MITLPAAAIFFALTTANAAPEGGASADGSISLSTKDGAKAEGKSNKKAKTQDGTPWIKRYAPQRMMMELGIFGGVLFPSKQHELYDPTFAWTRYKRVAPDIGLRFAFYPLRVFGLEIEGAVMPTKTDTDVGATLFAFRGHAIAQLPYRIAPFVLVGAGMMGASSDALGSDVDPSLHFGGGVKFFINRMLALRLDVRDNVGAAYQIDNGRTNHVEVLLGLSLTLGRKKEEVKKLIDSDGDGLFDPGQGLKPSEEDKCPNEPGPRSNQGCPLRDSDGDGLWDPGQGAPEDETDACPSEPGPRETKGCPPKDTDGDGFYDPGQNLKPEDRCPQEPETKNNYQDNDGCPDEVPKEVKKFTGAIRGINFDVDKDTIKANSTKTLEAAAKVLKDFPDVRIEISGHTDSDGSADHNRDLSRRRAEAVKKWMVDHGIEAKRIETRGAGPDEPVADNKTARGKAQNRRIEFKLLQGELEG